MKKNLTLIFIFLAFVLKAQIYVNSAATGSNNGTSWANAYTDLQSALNDTTNANIWIAKGTYKPVGPANDTTVFYRMTRTKSIFGGFAGTETAVTQRNPSTNLVILSGDVNGDDKADSVYVNKRDNRRHVLVVEPSVTGVASFDGITVSGGASRDTSRIRPTFREVLGAGILSYASLNINNCKFSGNRGTVGSAVATYDLDSIRHIVVNITKSSFTKNANIVATTTNQATTFGTAVYIWKATSLKVDSCIFSENVGARSALCIDSVLTSVLTNSSFTKNVNTANAAGGGYYSIRTRSSIVRNCNFIENSSSTTGTGAAMYFEVSTNTIPSLNYAADTTAINIVEKCIFKGNRATLGTVPTIRLVGGSNVLIKDNVFEDNISNGSAFTVNGNAVGGVSSNITGRAKNIIFTNNVFEKNNTTDGTFNVSALSIQSTSATIEKCRFDVNLGKRGGAVVFTGTGAQGQKLFINDSEFNGNVGAELGGAIHNAATFQSGKMFVNNCKFNSNNSPLGGAFYGAFKSDTEISNSDFTLNTSSTSDGGGAIGIQNDSTSLSVINSVFNLNTSNQEGGVIFGYEGEYKLEFIKCRFEGNRSSESGGVINLAGARNAPSKFGGVFIDRCEFINNEGGDQAGAIYLSNKNAKIQNSVFSGNIATNRGNGGAISYNSTDSLNERPMLLVNNTFEGNTGAFISGVAVWVDTSRFTRSLVNFQNNLFIEDKGIQIEENKPKIISLGGNLFSNESSKAFTNTKDFVEVGFSFLDPVTYTLKPTSKAVNGGIAAGAPTYDFNSKVRVGIPDIGAVENGATVLNVNEKYLTEVAVFPNPTAERLTILDEKGVNSGDKYIIFDIAGKIVQRGKVNDSRTLDVSNINGGEHFVRIYGEKILQAKFLVVR
jgi:hypothetical protein